MSSLDRVASTSQVIPLPVRPAPPPNEAELPLGRIMWTDKPRGVQGVKDRAKLLQ